MSNKTDVKTQNNKVMSKREIELEDGVLFAFIALDRAKHLIEDTVDDFFDSHNVDNENSHRDIIFDFNKYRAYMECANMLICDAYYRLQQLGASRF